MIKTIKHKNNKMEKILASLHADERCQIESSNKDFISQINNMINNEKDFETKVKLLCNVTGRMFVRRRDWLMISPHGLETVEAVITKHWSEIKANVTPELRKAMLDRCIAGAEKTTIDSFYSFADKILPTN
jgi:hypothetical protein